MKMILNPIASHTHPGRREYQEDHYAYTDHFIMVSDGVGGLAKGDIASDLVQKVWSKALEQNKITLSDLEGSVQNIIIDTIRSLLSYASEHPESMGMGATLACAAIIDGQLVCIHIGDSRIYLFSKDGVIKWRSSDHSLVQELVTGGIITEEEAINHPRRNVITRVLQAKEGHETKADIHLLKNVSDGDILLACTDGINESWRDSDLSAVMIPPIKLQEKLRLIADHCVENSRDNNTAVMAQVSLSDSPDESARDLSTKASVVHSDYISNSITVENINDRDPLDSSTQKINTSSRLENDSFEINRAKNQRIIPKSSRNFQTIKWLFFGIALVLLYLILHFAMSKFLNN